MILVSDLGPLFYVNFFFRRFDLFFKLLAGGFVFIEESSLLTSGGCGCTIVDGGGVDIDDGAGYTDFFQIF